MTGPSTDVIAVFNTSEDATDLLRVVFEQRLCRGDRFHPLLRDGKVDGSSSILATARRPKACHFS